MVHIVWLFFLALHVCIKKRLALLSGVRCKVLGRGNEHQWKLINVIMSKAIGRLCFACIISKGRERDTQCAFLPSFHLIIPSVSCSYSTTTTQYSRVSISRPAVNEIFSVIKVRHLKIEAVV